MNVHWPMWSYGNGCHIIGSESISCSLCIHFDFEMSFDLVWCFSILQWSTSSALSSTCSRNKCPWICKDYFVCVSLHLLNINLAWLQDSFLNFSVATNLTRTNCLSTHQLTLVLLHVTPCHIIDCATNACCSIGDTECCILHQLCELRRLLCGRNALMHQWMPWHDLLQLLSVSCCIPTSVEL